MTMVFTVLGSKGGTGKTTLTAALAALFADVGQRVLLIDADIQPTLSNCYALTTRAEGGLLEVLHTSSLEGCISRTSSGCDLVYSNDPDASLNVSLRTWSDANMRLKRALREAPYDLVFVDTQGALTPLLETAILAADRLITPIVPTAASAGEYWRGTLGIVKRLAPMKEMNLPVGDISALLYMVDRTRDGRETTEVIRELMASLDGFPVPITLLDASIPSLVVFREAFAAQAPVHTFERRSGKLSAREALVAVASELLPVLKPQLQVLMTEAPV